MEAVRRFGSELCESRGEGEGRAKRREGGVEVEQIVCGSEYEVWRVGII